MSRNLHANTSTALQGRVIRPVLIARLDILSDPLTVWTGPGIFAPTTSGDTAMDNQIFMPMAPITDISDIQEDRGIGGPVTLSVSGHDLDEDLLRQIVRDKRQWRGRNAWLWMGLLAADQKSVINYPFRIKTGVITNINTLRDAEDARVQVTIDRDLGNARSAPFRWIDHARIHPADKFSTFVVDLANKPEGYTAAPVYQDPSNFDPTDRNYGMYGEWY